MVYRLWAAARGAILKEWFVREGHASAWGQGKGKGADTAAWMATAQAELAAAGGYDAFAASTARSATTTSPFPTPPSRDVSRVWGGSSPSQQPSTRGSATCAGRVPCPGQSILPTVYQQGAHWPTVCSTFSYSGP